MFEADFFRRLFLFLLLDNDWVNDGKLSSINEEGKLMLSTDLTRLSRLESIFIALSIECSQLNEVNAQ